MKEKFEFEIKSRILEDNLLLNDYLSRLPKAIKSSVEIDVYHDTPNYELYQKGIFLRTRDGKKLEIKMDNDALLSHTVTTGFYFNLPLAKPDKQKLIDFLQNVISIFTTRSKSIFEIFNLTTLIRVEKKRQIYKVNEMKISIDSVENLGKFIEIEVNDRNFLDQAKMLASKLNLQNMEVGYVELLLRETNRNAYNVGRYKLDSDKKNT